MKETLIRKICMLLTVFSCLATVATAATKTVTISNIKYSINTETKRAQVKGRSSEATKNWKLVVPSELLTDWGTVKVTSIASGAFMYDDYLTSGDDERCFRL